MPSSDTQALRGTMAAINAAWVKGDVEELNEFFHDNMVIVLPGFEHRAAGKEACVRTYKEFLSQAVVHEFEESNHAVDLFGPTAVVSYRFDITYEMNAQTFREAGHDLFVFVRENDRWLAVWRTLVPIPAAQ